jgi:hypothetical protein
MARVDAAGQWSRAWRPPAIVPRPPLSIARGSAAPAHACKRSTPPIAPGPAAPESASGPATPVSRLWSKGILPSLEIQRPAEQCDGVSVLGVRSATVNETLLPSLEDPGDGRGRRAKEQRASRRRPLCHAAAPPHWVRRQAAAAPCADRCNLFRDIGNSIADASAVQHPHVALFPLRSYS